MGDSATFYVGNLIIKSLKSLYIEIVIKGDTYVFVHTHWSCMHMSVNLTTWRLRSNWQFTYLENDGKRVGAKYARILVDQKRLRAILKIEI